MFDRITDFDLVGSLDDFGGIASSGTYDFGGAAGSTTLAPLIFVTYVIS